MLKILLGNTVAELQLAYLNNAAAYEFSHKLYELQRSKFFSPLTTLFRFTHKMSSESFSELKEMIAQNISSPRRKAELMKEMRERVNQLAKMAEIVL